MELINQEEDILFQTQLIQAIRFRINSDKKYSMRIGDPKTQNKNILEITMPGNKQYQTNFPILDIYQKWKNNNQSIEEIINQNYLDIFTEINQYFN